MNLRSCRILRELRAGKEPIGFKLNLGDWPNLENQIRAAKLYDVDTIVRVERGTATM